MSKTLIGLDQIEKGGPYQTIQTDMDGNPVYTDSISGGASSDVYIVQGSDPQVISGIIQVSGTYDIDGGSSLYDMYRLNAEIVVPGGNNIYVNYIGSITITGSTFKPFSNRGLVDAIDPGGFENVQTSLTTGALVYDEVLTYAAPVDLILVNYDNTTSASTYDVFMIAGNTNNFSCKVYVDHLFYVQQTDPITFSN